MKRRWSDHEAKLARQWYAAQTPIKEIAIALERSPDAVKSKLFPKYVKKGQSENWGWNDGPIRESTIAARKRAELYGQARYEDR